jgi:hypothetical protein
MKPGSNPAIDEIISRFFAVFDNRAGRIPEAQAFRVLFTSNATIATHSGRGVQISTPDEFVSPRIELLTSGRLVEFHEWETQSETETLGSLAVRRTRYAKSGRLDGGAYAGEGTKFFQLAQIDEEWRIVSLAWIDDAASGTGET